MMQTIHLPKLAIIATVLLLIAVAGCGSPSDERLAEFAKQSMAEQVKQNDRLAEQSTAIVNESHQLAEAAKLLVERDAEARRELISAHSQLTRELNAQQSTIHAGQQQLEQERREIAQQRHRDPIIAAVIENFGLIIACLLPLLIVMYLIGKMQTQEPDHAAVAELLTLELTSDNPRLLPRPHRRRQRLRHDDEAYLAAHLDSIAGDSTDDEGDTPF